jgi:hypothetical protein
MRLATLALLEVMSVAREPDPRLYCQQMTDV